MNEYVHAIRTDRMHEFRQRYREGIDVLLVDDVQFLAGKDGTQDEFFHTFNALHDGHQQIVLTADRKPHEISDIADRLRTRFAWGLLADIEPPELEVRVAILRKKAAAEQIHLPDDVALYIATAIKSNVRELEGALIRLAAYASLSERDIDLDFARETLEGSLTRPREHLTVEPSSRPWPATTASRWPTSRARAATSRIAGPRAVAMYLARTHTKDSYPDLGRAFGGKHHTTVISAVEKSPSGSRRPGAARRDPRHRGRPAAMMTASAAARRPATPARRPTPERPTAPTVVGRSAFRTARPPRRLSARRRETQVWPGAGACRAASRRSEPLSGCRPSDSPRSPPRATQAARTAPWPSDKLCVTLW